MIALPQATSDARRRVKLFALITATFAVPLLGLAPVQQCAADEARPIERAGRWAGFGWSDGYHACKSSGIRPGADLPPKSYGSTYGVNRPAGGNIGCGTVANECGTTFYHRFDAAKAIACDGPKECDSIPNAGYCDSSIPQSYEPTFQIDLPKPISPSKQIPQPSPISPPRSSGPSVMDQTQIDFADAFKESFTLPEPIVSARPATLPLVRPEPSPIAMMPTAPSYTVPSLVALSPQRPTALPTVEHVVKFQAGPTPAPLTVLPREEPTKQVKNVFEPNIHEQKQPEKNQSDQTLDLAPTSTDRVATTMTTAIRPTRLPRISPSLEQPQPSEAVEIAKRVQYDAAVQSNPFFK